MSQTEVLSSTDEVNLQEQTVKYVFWRHVERNVPHVLPELESADIILLESSAMQAKREKILQESFINTLLGAPLTRKQKGAFRYTFGDEAAEHLSYKTIVKDSIPKVVGPLEAAIIDKYHDTGKLVRFLDANPTDHPEVANACKVNIDNVTAFNARLEDGYWFAASELVDWNNDYLNEFGRVVIAREAIVKEQINSYREEFPGKTIAVAYGANHTSISHQALRDGSGSRVFTRDVAVPISKIRRSYGVDGEALRRMIFNKPAKKDLAARTIVRNSMVSLLGERRGVKLGPKAKDLWDYEDKVFDLYEPADKIVRNLTDTQMAECLAVFDALHEGQPDAETRFKVTMQRFMNGE